MTDAPAQPRIPAATLVIFRQPNPAAAPELLMVQRAATMRFAAGAAVFPGGRIDAADHDLAARMATATDLDDLAARIAAIRETLEETGLALGLDRPISAAQAAEARRVLQAEGALAPVLDRFGWGLPTAALVPFARWCQPDVGGFDTRFFLANLGTGAVDIAVDATENSQLFWASAAAVLAHADAGAMRVIFPTRRNLERLARHADFAEACADAAAHPVVSITARREWREGQEWLTIPAGLGYPVLGEPLAKAQRG
jgi:8-oxo-dGTP pyrophosphatase MutT (NUDIX family)